MDLRTRNKKLGKKTENPARKKPLGPRFQVFTTSPCRYKLICTKFDHRKTYRNRSLPPQRLSLKSPSRVITPSFSPKVSRYAFISEPLSPYDLKCKDLVSLQKDFSSKMFETQEKTKQIANGLEQYRKGCKDLEKIIIKKAQQEKDELIELSMRTASLHKRKNELIKEVKNNNFFEVESLMILYPELINEVDSTLQTALHWAARRNQVKMVKFLLSSGANFRIRDSAGRTPEMIARKYGCSEVLKIFIEIERRSALDLSNFDGAKNKDIKRNNSLKSQFNR